MNFSCHPGAAHNGVIDYATAEGRKSNESASKKLNETDEDAFDCVPEGLASMLNRLKITIYYKGNQLLSQFDNII